MTDFSPPPLSTLDWIALGWYFVAWVGYVMLADHSRFTKGSLDAIIDGYRLSWMREMMARELRMVDAQIQNLLQHGSSFFASTSIIVVGGMLAGLGAADDLYTVFWNLPFADHAPIEVWKFKLLLVLGVFVYAFFKFARSFRLSMYVSILIGAAPRADVSTDTSEAAAQRVAIVSRRAGKHSRNGIRGYFFALAALAWQYHAIAFMIATAAVVAVTWRREFASASNRALVDPG